MSKKEECYSCGYTTYLKEYDPPPHHEDRSKDKLCKICSSTFIGVAYGYPKQHPDSLLFRSMGYIGNLLLEEIKKSK